MAGFLFKTDDEIEDIDFIKSANFKEYIRTLSIAVFSILFLENTYIAWFVALCVVPISMYLKQVDTPFWKSLIPLPYLAIALNIQGIPSLLSLLSAFITFGACAFFCVIEAVVFPEEISLVKLGTRILLIFIFLAMIYFQNTIPSTTSILSLCIGYCLASSIIKLYTNSTILIPAEEYENNELMKEIQEKFNEAIIVNKEVLRKFFTFIVIYFNKLKVDT